MNATPELVAMIQRAREAEIRPDHLASVASCARACCNSTFMTRLARALRPAASSAR